MTDKYLPANKSGTLWQQAQYWLEKAIAFEANGKIGSECEMAFKMALKNEAEASAVRA